MSLAAQFMDGQNLLESLIDSCAFIHDDWTDSEGVGGWGQYTTNPLLLSPPVCVTSPLDGFGEHTIDHLRSLGAFAGEVITPAWVTNDLTLNLSNDDTAMRALRRVVRSERLHISTFYNDSGRGVDEVAEALSSPEHTVRVYPSQEAFGTTYNKLYFDRFTVGVPTPQSASCESLEDVKAFATSRRPHPGLVVKMGHRDILFLQSPDAIDAQAHHFTYPLRVETAYPITASPIVNAVRFRGRVAPLFIIDQYIRDWLHWGNGSPASGSPSQRAMMVEYTLRIGEQLTGYEGAFGVDFILTPDGGVYAVDINARFCTSTYPYALVTAAGFDPNRVHSRFRLVPCRLDSLDDITRDPAFVALKVGAPRGAFLYCPVSYPEYPHPVHYLNYVCVGDSPEMCLALDADLLALIERHSAGNR